jgi:hypothetical protein
MLMKRAVDVLALLLDPDTVDMSSDTVRTKWS